jgi:hypothetical protein
VRPDKHAGPPVARYLRPEEAVVPFRHRPELDELFRWCVADSHAAVRLVTGDGGTGKTRLALRLGEELAANGWQSLWVPRDAERDAVQAVHTIGQPCVLVVDYAETRGELAGLLDDLAADHDGPDLRLLLLARSAGEWWAQLLANAEEQTAALLESSAPLVLGPMRATGGPQEIFDEAVAAFARRMGIGRLDVKLALSDLNPVVLVVHAAALLTVVDYVTGARQRDRAISGRDVLEALLRHEARYWARSAAGRGLDLDVSVLRLAVAVGCLIGADSETAAAALLRRVPDLDSAERLGQVARWLRDLYPARQERGPQEWEWLGPLRPDRLAEQLITSELTSRPELVAPLFTGLSHARSTRALTVMARAALMDDRAISLLGIALTAHLDHLALPAILVAVETNPIIGELLSQALTSQSVSRETLSQVADASPYPSLALAAPAAVVYQRLADDSSDYSERARWLVDLGNRLAELGRREEALAASEEAAGLYRQLAQARPDAFLPYLATALSNQSTSFADVGRREEALAASEEATGLYRQLAQARPDAFLPDLAMSLNNRSGFLSSLGRREEALAASEEAATIRRQLAQARPDTFLPDLAMSLNNQSTSLHMLGRREEALAAIEEAATIHRQLAQARPDTFLPNLAMSLNNLSLRLADLERREEALAAIEEAVTIRRQLVQARPDAFLPYLAGALNNQSIRVGDLGRREEALAAIEEAVTIHRQLAQARPDAFLPDLAGALNNLSIRLGDLGRLEALTTSEEAVTVWRQLAQARPDAFLPDLARSLNNRSWCLDKLGRREEALAAIEEAVTIRRQLAQARPDAFLPYLAGALNNQSSCLADLGRREEALAAIEEAAGLYRQLARARPAVFLPDLVTALNNLAETLSGLNRDADASMIRREANAAIGMLAQRPVERASNEANVQPPDL